ncbi:hypothetical protein [Streptomyces sp. NPDC058295]|uniref:hypothetical protein n=1 Tax=Streptomyces sp. NPDC058295 TaxID=3346431 RepID=UPI0036E8A2C7
MNNHTTPEPQPTVWVDGDPLMEAIAAAIWEQCERHAGGGSGIVVDDPRNIAAAAASAVRPPATDHAALREQIAEALGSLQGTVHHLPPATRQAVIDAVLAVLPEPADRTAEIRAALLRELADKATEWDGHITVQELRRMARKAGPAAAGPGRTAGVAQSEPEPPTPRCAHCRHPKGDHDGRADHRERYSPLVAGDPWCHACDAGCDYTPAVGGAQQPKADGNRVVAYRSALPGAWSIYCTRHTSELGDGVIPLTSDDLPDGGLCASCGVDVLIEQQTEATDRG